MTLLAIDPGLNGALGLFEGETIVCKRMPKLTDRGLISLHTQIKEWGVTVAVIEAQYGWANTGDKRNGSKGLFTQGVNYGKLLTVLYLLGLQVVEVPSIVWMPRVPIIDIPETVKSKAATIKNMKDTKLRTLAWANHLGVNVWGPKGGLLDGVADVACLGWVYSKGLLADSYYNKEGK